MRSLSLILLSLVLFDCASFRNAREEVGTSGAVVVTAGQTKLLSKDFVDTYYKAQSDLIAYRVKFKGLNHDEAWKKQYKLDAQLKEAYSVLDKLQSLEILLHKAVLLKVRYEKEGLEVDEALLQNITRYSLEVASLISEAANLMAKIKED